MATTLYKPFWMVFTDRASFLAYQNAYPTGVYNQTPAAVAGLIHGALFQGIEYVGVNDGSIASVWYPNDNTLDHNTLSVTIPGGYTLDQNYNLVAFGPPAPPANQTFAWRGNIVLKEQTPTPPPHQKTIRSHYWMEGFEIGTASASTAVCRAASRSPYGLGYAIRNNAPSAISHDEARGVRSTWERFYIRCTQYPTQVHGVWNVASSRTSGLSVGVTQTGQVAIYSTTSVDGGAFQSQCGPIPLNQWVRVDMLVFLGVTGQPANITQMQLYLNAGKLGSCSASFSPGGTADQTQNRSQIGGQTSHGGYFDIDDWTCKTRPDADDGDGSAAFTNYDWRYGNHISQVRLTGFGPNHGSWTGDFRLLDGLTSNTNVPGALTSTTPNDIIEVNTLANDYYMAGGLYGIQVDVYSKVAGTVTCQVGWDFGAGPTLTNRTMSNNSWSADTGGLAKNVISSVGAGTALGASLMPQPPFVTGGFRVRYVRDNSAISQSIEAVTGAVDSYAYLGPEDSGVEETVAQALPRVLQNHPYQSLEALQVDTRPLAPVQVMSGTYTGNGTGQDIDVQCPVHWVWIRPTSGVGNGGSRWSSALTSAHDSSTQSMIRQRAFCYYDSTNGGYRMRISGSDANNNQNGITYQWVGFSDPSCRYLLNHQYVTDTGAHTVVLPDQAFLPLATMIWNESNGASAGDYYVGTGYAGGNGSLLGTGDSANVATILQGQLTMGSVVNASMIDVGLNNWRMSDGTYTGAVYVGNYTGNGAGARTLTIDLQGKSPIFAMIVPHASATWYFRDPSHTGTNSQSCTSSGTVANAITGGGANSISIDAACNANAVVYELFVLAGSTQAGWSPNPGAPIILVPTVPPSDPGPFSGVTPNGWWVSIDGFGSATATSYPPSLPRDPRTWTRLAPFTTAGANAGSLGGFPGPGVVTQNRFFYYAGNDYTSASGPTIRVFDGQSDREVVTVPAFNGVAPIAIVAMIANGTDIYLTTLDSGTTSADFAGRVLRFDTQTLGVTQIGAQFTTGEVPYALCFYLGRLFMGTNKGDGSAAKLYWFRTRPTPGSGGDIDTSWTTDRTFVTDGLGGCASLAVFQSKLYVGCTATTAMGTNKILTRDSLGTWGTAFTHTVAGTFTTNNGSYSMVTFNGNLYIAFWNPDSVTPEARVIMWDGNTWTVVSTVTGAAARPYISLFVAKAQLFVLGGGSGKTPYLAVSATGSAWTNLTPILPSAVTSTATPIIGQIGS